MVVVRQTFKDLANNFVNDTFNDFTVGFTFEEKNTLPDGQGGFTVGWAVFANVKGFAKTISAKEAQINDHIKHENIKKFSFEYIANLDENMRINYNGHTYNIHSVSAIQDADVWVNVIAYRDGAT